MKKITLLLILCIGILKGYSQCPDCHEGMNYSRVSNQSMGRALPPDSTGGLAKSYILENVCGLNWSQSSVLVETRSQAAHFNTNGTGLPCSIPITFDSCGVDSVIKAFLYFNGSYQTNYAANPASVTITNPVATVFHYSVDSIGTGPPKCWGDVGTIAYRADVTNAIFGGGNYVVNLTGTGLTSWAIDGMTLLIIYKDKSASYSGSIVLYDGLWTGGATKSQTFTGFNVCNATPTGQAFSILADMQSNVSGGHNVETYNGSTNTFNNLFYNFCTVTTSLTAGQTSTTYSVYTNDAGDCYSWVIAGLYWQNTNCVTCTPSINPTLTLNIVPPSDTICGRDSVQLTASGANTFIWSPATGLSCTNCPNPKALPNSTTTYTVTGFNGCAFGKDTVQIVIAPQTTPTVTPTNPQICYPDSVQLTVTGGGPYVWKPAATLSCNSCTNPWASPTVTTTYTVYSGALACKDSAFVTVNVEPSPNASVLPKNPKICAGGSVTLNASGASSYSWTPFATLSCNVCSNPIATPTVTTVYTLVASNGFCNQTITDTVYVVPAPIPSIVLKPDSICQGDSALLIGGGGGTYKWNTNQTTDSIWVKPASTRTYTLYVSNGACSDSMTVSVLTIPKVTATIQASLDSICPGQSTKITVTPAGGAATYSWSPGGATSSSITVMPASTMSYTATVTGECNTFTLIQPITVVPFPQPVIQGTNWKCRGVRDTLVASNLNGPATYVWSNGSTATSIKTGPIDGDSSVTLTAYNKLGCPHDTTFFITLRSPLGVTVPPPAIFCAGSLVCISATISGSPTNPVSYSWTPGGGSTDTICVSPTDTTTYIVTVSNGCKSTRATTLTPNYPNLYSCCSQTISIVDDTVTPGKVILSASGNSKTYQWDPATTVTCLNPRCDSVKLNPTPSVTTTYTITGTDSNGCSISQLITITVDVPCFNLIIPNVFTPTNGGSLGLDKVFYINARNMDAWTITIFDRWGKQVFNSTDTYDYWTGNTPSGGAAPAGVYYYVISGTCQGTTYKRDGYVQVIR